MTTLRAALLKEAKNPNLTFNWWLENNVKPARTAGRFVVDTIPYTPLELIQEMCAKIPVIANKELDKSIAVIYTVEIAAYLAFIGFTNITLITRERDELIASKAGMLGYVYMLETDAVELGVTFDVVVGNPPFNAPRINSVTKKGGTTTTGDLFPAFTRLSIQLTTGWIGLVLPSKSCTNAKSKTTKLIINSGLKYCYECSTSFGESCKLPTCFIILSPGHNGACDIRNSVGEIFTETPTTVVPLYGSAISQIILKKVQRHENIAQIRSKPDRIYRDDVRWGQGDIPIIAITGKAGDPIVYNVVKDIDINDFPHYNMWKVITNANGTARNKIGAMKIATPRCVTGSSVVSFGVQTEMHANNLKMYMESNLVSYLISILKTSCANTQKVFAQIPLVDLTRTWTDEELYTHFNLTQEEIDLIESTIK